MFGIQKTLTLILSLNHKKRKLDIRKKLYLKLNLNFITKDIGNIYRQIYFVAIGHQETNNFCQC